MTEKYHAVTTRTTVLMKNDLLFSEFATHIEMTDESGGPFIVVYQIPSSKRERNHSIHIDIDSWPSIRAAIDQMVAESDKCTV